MTSRKLKIIRNIIMLLGTAAAFLIWLGNPAWIENNAAVHVGTGRYGTKAGSLIVLLFPLVTLIPHRPNAEIHTADEGERAGILEEREKRSARLQIIWAAAMSAVACSVMCMWRFV